MSDISSRASYGVNSLLVVAGGLTLTEWVAIGGFLLGLLTYITNVYFQHKRTQLHQQQLERDSALLRQQLGSQADDQQ